jgi:ribosome-associated translation inhibitor RaiA
MNYQITSDNIEMSPSMQTLARQKMQKIENRLDNLPDNLKSARIVMNKEKDGQFSAKIHLVIKGKEYIAEQTGFNLENALVEAVILIERDLQTDKIIQTEEDWKEAREAKRFDPADQTEINEEMSE